MVCRIHTVVIFALALFLLHFGAAEKLCAQIPGPEAVVCTNGFHMAPYGRLHLLIIYAELEFDSTYSNLNPVPGEGNWQWKKGTLPIWKDEIISPDPAGDGFMTKYYGLASFGKFQVTGDYIDTVITVRISEIRNKQGNVVTQESFANGFYKNKVLEKVTALDSTHFAHGSSLSEFDRWTGAGTGLPKKEQPNGQFDLVMIIWRNLHVANMGNHSGYVSPGSAGRLFGKESDMYSQFRVSDHLPYVIMRHEFAHMLYGGNNFHTANGGVGQRTFMATVGGYSNLSASDAAGGCINAWDRDRMGWKNPAHQHLISARDAEGKEVSGDLHYGDLLPQDGIFVLRDFITQGDFIRIELPHLPDSVMNQYLWIENRQLLEKRFDQEKSAQPGIYAFITAGKDARSGQNTFGGRNNYMWPLVAIGHYDFLYRMDSLILQLDRNRANPFTGYHFHMRHPMDLDHDHKIRLTTDMKPRSEYILPERLEIDGQRMPESYFSYMTYPIFGSKEMHFTDKVRNKIHISRNPAPVPVYTFAAPSGPMKDDNRRIYLNGISVEILSQEADGDVRIRVRWDDFDIDQDVRWCGDILSEENIFLGDGKTLTLDQGFSPQVPDSVQEVGGKGVYAMPTVLELAPNSFTRLGELARLRVKRGSTLLVRAGATLELGRAAELTVEEGSYICLEQGAKIIPAKKSKFVLRPGASEGIHPLQEKKYKVVQPLMEIPAKRSRR